jgi:hypothetical protein
MKNRILSPLVSVFVGFVLVAAAVFVITCTNPNNLNNVNSEQDTNSIGEISDTPDGVTRLVVAMHDDPSRWMEVLYRNSI